MPLTTINEISNSDIVTNPRNWILSIVYAIIGYFIDNADVYFFFLGSVFIHCFIGGLNIYKYDKENYRFKKNVFKFFTNSFTASLALLFALFISIFMKLQNGDTVMMDSMKYWSIKAVLVLTLVFVVRSLRNYHRWRTSEELPEFDAMGLITISFVKSGELIFKRIAKWITSKGGCEDVLEKQNKDEDNR